MSRGGQSVEAKLVRGLISQRCCCLPSASRGLFGLVSSVIFGFFTCFLVNLFQRYVSFMTDLRGADSLLQKAIEKVEDGKKLDTAQVIRHTGSL